MCGITGVIGHGAPQKAFEGLKALEYRGYDSWGIAVPGDGKFYLERHVGKIGAAESSGLPDALLALGHTRWATHGKVSEKNCHPHLSMDGKIAIVHNGIVENFAELKRELMLKKFTFKSDTDSEVIANLIQDALSEKGVSFEEAVRLSLLRLEGYYAVAAIRLGEGKIVCGRNGSPLVLGIGKENLFVASDATGFLCRTKKAVFLNDSEMAVLTGDLKFRVISVGSGKEAGFKIKELQWGIEQAKKGAYEHFMLKEICEQPSAIRAAAEQPEEKLGEIGRLVNNSTRIYLVGCGSSYHACLCGAYFFSRIARLEIVACLASEFSMHAGFLSKDSLVIAVSQSGETADTLEAIKAAKAKGAKIASIVNAMDSSIMRMSDFSLLMNAGPEICVLSTKSYTAQLVVLLLLAYTAAGKKQEGKATVLSAAKDAEEILNSSQGKIKALAKKISASKDIFVIGRSDAFPSALEAALKIKEVSYIHAEGFAGGELKHGTIALIEDGTPAIVLSTPETKGLTLSNAIEMQSRGAFIIGVDSTENRVYDFSIKVPDSGAANPVSMIVPVQLLAYYLALERGLDPDKPRNLAKSVTVK
ncbi:Glutamine--fructose-6-phosphate aminotransferase [isomerizing] [uncultured archaeon]|nr:Glutamine--fructose-6-phosphate aminotransferase [isomerizing] [uncultured archaeon]